MQKLKAVIVDDEERARNSLALLLETYCEGVEISARCSTVDEAELAIKKDAPDLVFLDIEMPRYSGFELFHRFEQINFDVIFVTAYNDYAIKAFEVSAVDYLLKPIDIEKLKVAVEKVKAKRDAVEKRHRLELLEESMKAQHFNKIALPSIDGVDFVNTSDIVYLEADGAYTEVWLSNNSKFIVSKKLKFFEEILSNKPHFFRSHRSFIVNVNAVKHYSKAENSFTLDNGKQIGIARERKAEFEQLLSEHNLKLSSK